MPQLVSLPLLLADILQDIMLRRGYTLIILPICVDFRMNLDHIPDEILLATLDIVSP